MAFTQKLFSNGISNIYPLFFGASYYNSKLNNSNNELYYISLPNLKESNTSLSN